jgi:hypothetical protein
VRLILEIDVQLLENEFVNGSREGDRVLYVSSYNKDGNTMDIWDEDTWEEHWQSSNKSFEKILDNDKDYERFYGKMFFVWEVTIGWQLVAAISIRSMEKIKSDIILLIV